MARKPRYVVTRAIRRVSLAQMNEADARIGSLDIAHETDLKFLETLESFAVQMAGEDDLLLDLEPLAPGAEESDVAAARMAGAHEVQEATGLEPADASDALDEADLEDVEPEFDDEEFVDLDAEIESIQASLEAETADPEDLDVEPPTLVDAGRKRTEATRDPAENGSAPPGSDAAAVVAPPPLDDDLLGPDDLDVDPDEMEPDTGELLAAVEQTYSELESLGETAGESDLADLEGEPLLDSEGLGDIDLGPMQSWDGTSLDEYLTASPGEPGLASWDGDSLEEYIARNPDASGDLASWDGTSYEEYLAQHPTDGPVPPRPSAGGERDSSVEVDAWLAEQKLPAPTADTAVDPLGLGDGHEADEPREPSRDGDTAVSVGPVDASGESVVHDELVASQAMEVVLGEPAFSLDLEESGELDLGLDPDEEDVPSSAIEVRSQNELIVQVGAGLDAALSAEPLSLVLDVEEGTGSELSMGPVDDLSTGLAIPRSASLAALARALQAPVAGDPESSSSDASAEQLPGGKKERT